MWCDPFRLNRSRSEPRLVDCILSSDPTQRSPVVSLAVLSRWTPALKRLLHIGARGTLAPISILGKNSYISCMVIRVMREVTRSYFVQFKHVELSVRVIVDWFIIMAVLIIDKWWDRVLCHAMIDWSWFHNKAWLDKRSMRTHIFEILFSAHDVAHVT
jgi:hypothetical protein